METQNLLNSFIEKYTERLDGLAVKDLKLNFEKVTTSGQLDTEELSLLIISLGKMLEFEGLMIVGIENARANQIPDTLINEALQIPAIMGMLNTYYKFRFFSEKNDSNASSEYGSPGLRMNALAKPLMGKEKFEIISLAISILNSCEKCVISHEKAVLDLGVSRNKIHDVMKLTAIVKGLSSF